MAAVVQGEGTIRGNVIGPAVPLQHRDGGASSGASSAADAVPPSRAAPAPEVGWDLQMQPESLNASFWREQARRYAKWDAQVGTGTRAAGSGSDGRPLLTVRRMPAGGPVHDSLHTGSDFQTPPLGWCTTRRVDACPGKTAV